VRRIARLIVALILIAAAAAMAWLALGITRPYKGYTEPERFVEVPQGAGPASISRRLADAGVIRDRFSFRVELARSGVGRRLQAGEYRFDRPMTVKEVVAKLSRGEVYLLPITFREGLTIKQMSEIFEAKGFGPRADFVAAAGDRRLVASFDPEARDLEGFLFPDTYALERHATAAQLVARMVAGFEKVLTPELRTRAQARGLSVHALVTLASIVEKETGNTDERPLVAAVYSNRLKTGMGLQCDPTVIFALDKAGRYTGNLTKEDLHFDSPYNTYRYAGLPPGPIASPGRASLEAAVHPADAPYLYFVSRNDGTHAFSSTLAEHNHNVFEYQVKAFRR
jgi:UPF0755 protein